MNASLPNSENFDEILFENRHKNYGAYAIRKAYHDNVLRSVLITYSAIGILAFLLAWFSNREIKLPDIDLGNDANILTKVIEVDLPHAEKPKPVDPVKQPEAPRSESGQLVAKNDPVTNNTPTNNNMNVSNNPNPNGTSDSTNHEPVIPKVDPPTLPPAIERIPDKMPIFDNLNQVITRNLKYPEVAVINGTAGTVYVSFIVETDGSVSNIEVLKAIGDGCEQEAVRVVKLLQPWQPGIKNGKAVRVPCTLPIKFRLK